MNTRNLLLSTHRYLGLVLALFVALAGITGTALVFMDELDDWLNRDIAEVEAGAAPLPAAQLIALVEQHYPDARVNSFTLGETAHSAWLFKLGPRDKTKPKINEAWVDPYTGAVRGDRQSGAARFDRRHLMPALLKLHRGLFMDKAGETFMGIVAGLWLLSSLVGIYLALPRGGGLRKMLSIKWNGLAFKRWLDLHRVAGVLTAIVLLGTTFTALYLAVPEFFRAVLSPIASVSTSMVKQLPPNPLQTPVVNAEQAIAVAQRTFPDGAVRGVYLHRDKGVYQIRLRLANDINLGNGTARALVDMRSGQLVWSTSFLNAGSGGDSFVVWMFPLHSGQAFGLTGRLIILVIGLCPLLLAATGVYIYWHKRRARQRNAAGATARAAKAA